MRVKELPKAEQDHLRQCLVFVLESGARDGEFLTRLGVDPVLVEAMRAAWPDVDDASDDSEAVVAINNALNEVCHSVGVGDWDRWFTVSPAEVKALYGRWARARGWAPCDCAAWDDHQRIPLGWDTAPEEWFAPRFTVLRRRTPWLELVECVHCRQRWYIAVDTVDDDYYFHRLSPDASAAALAGNWPEVFDGVAVLWPDEGWFEVCGYASLEAWQETANGGEC